MRLICRSAPTLSVLLYLAFLPLSTAEDSGTVWATPHDSFSSSIGVLGCKINTDRVAYWPSSVDCTNICVQLSYAGRSVKLLKIDQSGGAYDVSYDAWNYLYTGHSAKDKPTTGGPVAMEYQDLPASECKSLIKTDGHKLPLSAPNSMTFLASCLEQPGSWVGKNYLLYNILDSICTWGVDEKCKLDWPAANQPACGSTMGVPVELNSEPVFNVQYGTGKVVKASSGGRVADGNAESAAVRSRTPLFGLVGGISGTRVLVTVSAAISVLYSV